MNNNKKIFLLLFVIVLLPALFYSAYEISALNETETMIAQLYDRQLDAILFSINQHILDVASSWATSAENALPTKKFDRILSSNPSVRSIIISDTSFRTMTVYPTDHKENLSALKGKKELAERLRRYRDLDYRKLEPVIDSDSTLMMLFAPASDSRTIIALMINNDRLIADVIGKKLTDIARNDFILSVRRVSTGETVFSTMPSAEIIESQQRALWIFPDFVVNIRLRGITVQDAANKRFYTNILLILLLDVVLLAGALFVYRLIKREMELVALKSDFVSNVSHELRTPLALIRMFAETLEMKRVPTEKKKQEYYGIILRETERLTRLINNILNFSRMESNSRRYTFSPVEINKVIDSVLTIYSYQFEQSQCTLLWKPAAELPLVSADEEAVAEALHNLIDNALKYGGEEKFIRIETKRTGTGVRIEIEDHGIGIPQSHQGKIFDKFYRVSHGLVHTAKGSGLGLAIVHHIIQSHGGSISVSSEPGKGSTFIIELPTQQSG